MIDLHLRAIVAWLVFGLSPHIVVAPAQAAGDKAVPWTEEFAYLTGMQAYIYGFPAIMYVNLRHRWIASGKGPIQMAVNVYWHSRELPDPMVLTVPPNPEQRHYTLQLMDFYSDTIGYIGVRATKNVPGGYLVTGLGWKGKVLAGIKGVIPSWTRWAMIAGRTCTDGSEGDRVKVRAFQDGYRITPLSRHHGKAAVSAAPRRTAR